MIDRAGLGRPPLWIALLALLAIVPAAVLAVYTGLEQRRLAAARVEADALRLTRLAAAGQKPLIEATRQLLVAVADLPEVRSGDLAACSGALADLLRRDARYLGLGVVAPDGTPRCSALAPGVGIDAVDRRSVGQAIETRGFGPGAYGIDPVSGKPAVIFAHPIVGATGAVDAVASAALDLGWLDRIASAVSLPEQATLVVVDASGTILTHHPEPGRWVGLVMPHVPLVRMMTTQGEGLAEMPGLDGVPRLYAFTEVGDQHRSGLFLAVGVSRDAALADANRFLVWTLAGLVVIAAATLGAAWVGGRRLDMMVAAMEAEQRAKEALMEQVSDLVAQRAREVGLLNQLGGLLQACLTAGEAAAVVGRLGNQLFRDAVGALFVIDPVQNLVERLAIWGTSPAGGPPLFTPDACWALRRGQVYVVPDTAAGLGCPHLGHPVPPAYLCVPLLVQGEALGVLHVGSDPATSGTAPPVLVETTQKLAVAVAEQVALSLANLRLRETLRAQSIRDPLTGLFNRRYMEETLERELQRAERSRDPLGVLLLDVDHFKRFNDSFGHDAGDAVLTALGALLRANVRGGDIACRHGGEEFVLILPGASTEETRRRAGELREAARALQVSHRSGLLGPVTFSVGVSAFPDHGTTGEVLLRAADVALYRAKREGRDQVVVAD